MKKAAPKKVVKVEEPIEETIEDVNDGSLKCDVCGNPNVSINNLTFSLGDCSHFPLSPELKALEDEDEEELGE